MKWSDVTFRLMGETVCLRAARYQDNGRLALQVVLVATGMPIGRLTVNVPEVELGPDEIAVKTYSENLLLAAGAYVAGPFRDTGRRVHSGLVEIPVWKITEPVE